MLKDVLDALRSNATLRRVAGDVVNLRNIEAYVIAIAAISFAVLTTFGDRVSDDLKMGAILASLSLLVFNLTIPRQGEGGKLDDFLNDRNDYDPFPDQIKNATSVWIYSASAINLLTGNAKSLKQHILDKPNGDLRLVLQDPTKPEAMQILIKQIDESIDFQVQDLDTSLVQAEDMIKKMQSWDCQGNVTYKFLPYSPGFGIVAIDADKPNGVIFVEFYGYHNEHIENRMHLKITRAQSERWYTYWVTQFHHIWDDSRFPDE